jgi:hypothetical protein
MVYARRKLQITSKKDDWYGSVSIPKMFLSIWTDLGATHCVLQYNSADNSITLFPERIKGGVVERLS